MKTQEYSITGMTCDSCLAKVQEVLDSQDDIESAQVQLNYPQATILSSESIDFTKINLDLSKKGNYTITEKKVQKELSPLPSIGQSKSSTNELPEKSIETYKPLIIIVAFISGVSLLAQYPFVEFSGFLWMRHFMAGFFLVFSFFKLLNIRGFADSYAMYDLLAIRWKNWGFIYPFLELLLGIAYLINFNPTITNWVTVAVLGFSSLGVIKSNLDNRQIKCACLGDVFNLPMSTVTIIEDLTMVGMAAWMLFM